MLTSENADLISALRGIGFSKNEATVYLATLELGAAPISNISRLSGIKRPTCYVLLEELAVKGYASSVNDGKRVVYSVVSPSQLSRTVERRQERFIKSMPELMGLASLSPQKPIVRLYAGVAGVIEAYNLSLEQPKESEILIYGTAEVKITYTDFIAEYLKNRVEKGIFARAILPNNSVNREVPKTDTKELRETRFLSTEKFDPTIEINIFSDTITYIAHSETEPFATVIESAAIATLEKQRFEIIWDAASK
jgi:sugar-specific transcriptional regulator TrmB